MLEYLLWVFFIFSFSIIIYHHFIYPILLKLLTYKKTQPDLSFNRRNYNPDEKDENLPTITIVIPMHNEEKFVIEKLNNTKVLDYPENKFSVLLLCDSCYDKTEPLIQEWLQNNKDVTFEITVKSFSDRQGKVALLNFAIDHCNTDLIAFNDTSALLSYDALLIAASHFADPKIGVVAGSYHVLSSKNYGELLYWKYQTEIKKDESKIGAPIGVHGSGYFVRAALTEMLPPDTINDDMILPMQIVAKGYDAIYEPQIATVEVEPSLIQKDLDRRKRISAGNWQQIFRLKKLLHPRFGGISFNFISGKVLRVFIPFALIITFLSSLSLYGYHHWLIVIIVPQIAFYMIAFFVHRFKSLSQYKLLSYIHYFVYGHLMTLVGFYRYVFHYYNSPWQRVSALNHNKFMHPIVSSCKWVIDKISAIIGLFLTVLLLPFVALLIKIESKGRVFHTQLYVGRQWPDHTEIFKIYKFRTMHVDDEKQETTWTSNGPQFTKVGKFLRKTRLDKLPQFINVLLGQMSLFGPRPERPKFYALLEKEIPFYSERVFGVKPGITGLAQVLVGYDQSLNDVKNKVAFDHAYALSLSKPWEWLQMECYITIMTIKTIVLSKGH